MAQHRPGPAVGPASVPVSADVIVIAIAVAKPGKAGDVEAALLQAASPTRDQPGNLEFTLLRSTHDPNVLVGFERWASEADHQRHLRASHIGQLMARFDGILVAEPVIASYSVIDE